MPGTVHNISAWWARIVVAIAVVIVSPTSVAEAGQSTLWQVCETGGRASLREQIAACSHVIEKARLSRQMRAIAHFNRAWAYNLDRQYDRALRDFDSAVKFDPRFPHAYRGKGDAYRRKGLARLAIGEFDRAIALKPDYAGAYFDRGGCHQALGAFERAVKDFNRAIALLPEIAGYYAARASAFQRLGRLRESLADLDRAIVLDAGAAEARAARGQLLLKMKQTKKAAPKLRPAIVRR